MPNHKKASSCGYVYEHIIVAENKIGRSLRDGETVHHIDGNRSNNNLKNIFVCIDRGHHATLHRMINATKDIGTPTGLKCKFCGQYDSPENLYVPKNGGPHHRECFNQYYRKYLQEKNTARRRNTRVENH